MIAGAIFDLDGTVLDSMTVWEHAPERYLSSLGVEAGTGVGQNHVYHEHERRGGVFKGSIRPEREH